MQRSSFLPQARAALRRAYRYLRTLTRNRYFWIGLAGLGVVGLLGYVLLNNLLMPIYTRHEVAVRVPEVIDLPYEEAQQLLAAQDLRVGTVVQRSDPAHERNVVLDQNPPPNALVKPGRRIYLAVNTGEVPMVTVPRVEEISLREAEARLQAVGLRVTDSRPDSIPSPHPNTVTRQQPAPGEVVPEGSSVTLWYSTGLGETYVTIPNVTGMTVGEAQQMLLERKLRSVVVGLDDYDRLGEPVIQRQSREPGTRVREGFELRLFLREE